MKTRFWILLGTLLSGAMFYLAHWGIEEAAEVSTGYNATTHGLFGWDYSFAEHASLWNGNENEWTQIAQGHKIKYPNLIAEIVFFIGVSYGVVIVARDFFSHPKESTVRPPSE